jgi:DNA-binding MurR/RpiR family transcriptional regulator
MTEKLPQGLGSAALPGQHFVARMERVARSGPPRLRALAAWLSDRPEELAFHSVRALAEAAGTDANVVMRTMKAAGYAGYAEAQKAVQDEFRQSAPGYNGYNARADAAARIGALSLVQEMAEAAGSNTRRAFDPALVAEIEALVPELIAARRVHCIGVRMAYGLTHYFAYRGSIAHANVMATPALPGLIADSLIEAGPEDIVIVVSFAHYSSEVLRAAQVARARGARVLALTDRRDSPLAEGAWRVLRAPVDGPNIMYSMIGATAILETLLELMAAQDPGARERISAFERRMLDAGAYTPAPGHRGA